MLIQQLTGQHELTTYFKSPMTRYLMVLTTGFEAMKSGDPIDYQRFYQQQSDVCMLRLFDSFAESAPQLVFHLYIMILKSQWPIEQVSQTNWAQSYKSFRRLFRPLALSN